MRLELFLSPADDPDLEAAGAAALAAICGPDGDVTRSEERPLAPRRDLDPVGVATLVLTVPGAVLAVAQLAERLNDIAARRETKTRIEPVLELARDPRREVTLQVGEETLDLGRVSPDRVLDALRAAGIAARGDR